MYLCHFNVKMFLLGYVVEIFFVLISSKYLLIFALFIN